MSVSHTLPTGTVAFLFTDLEGSTRLLAAHPVAYRDVVRRHHDLLRDAVEGHGGAVFETVGDAVYAAFARPRRRRPRPPRRCPDAPHLALAEAAAGHGQQGGTGALPGPRRAARGLLTGC